MIKSLKTDEVKSKEDVYIYLSSYLTKSIEEANRKMRDEDNFSLPSWAEYQAYQLGFIKALHKLLDQLPLTKGN